MHVRDVMSTEVISVMPDTPLKTVARLLVEHRISGLPVVDAGGEVVGVVSEADFLVKERGQELDRHPWISMLVGDHDRARRDSDRVAAQTAREAMTRPALTVAADATLAEAARKMAQRRINRLPVVADGKLVGIVTRADIVKIYAQTDEELRDRVAHAIRAVDGLRLVSVVDGVVTLSGTLQSQALATTVRSLVEQVDGVMAVNDADVAWHPEREAMGSPRVG